MKKLLFALVLFIGTPASQHIYSQISVNINLGLQPDWGPPGYDYVEYYYFPNLEVYYSVPSRQFVYLHGGNWVFSRHLPSWFGPVNLYRTQKVVINHPHAYWYFSKHKARYGHGHYYDNHSRREDHDRRHYSPRGHDEERYGNHRGQSHGKKHGRGDGSLGKKYGHGKKGRN